MRPMISLFSLGVLFLTVESATLTGDPSALHAPIPEISSKAKARLFAVSPQYRHSAPRHVNSSTVRSRVLSKLFSSIFCFTAVFAPLFVVLGGVLYAASQRSSSPSIVEMAMAATSGAKIAVSRRDALAGAAAVGLLANKVAVEGPPVFRPAPGSLSGRKILITGGTHGLGFETAVRLATAGATVVITARSNRRGQQAVADIQAQSGNDSVSHLVLDLASLDSVRECARTFTVQYNALHVLVANAGVMAIPRREVTTDGFERQFGTNHLGHFALTALLQPLRRGAEQLGHSRVVVVASAASFLANRDAVDPSDPRGLSPPETYSPWGAYCQSKLANVMFSTELDRRYKAAGIPITAMALHPGLVRTELGRYLVSGTDAPLSETTPNPATALVLPALWFFSKGVERGANTQVWLAAGADNNGQYDKSGGLFFQNLQPLPPNPVVNDAELRRRFWQESECLTGIPFRF